jgi:hypothetical protein
MTDHRIITAHMNLAFDEDGQELWVLRLWRERDPRVEKTEHASRHEAFAAGVQALMEMLEGEKEK